MTTIDPPANSRVALPDLRYRRATAADAPRLNELIESADLPARFVLEHIAGFVVAEHRDRIVGCCGLEIYEDTGMLRSLVVEESLRDQGIGHDLIEILIEDARRAGLRDLYLFTLNARAFLARFGFGEVPLDAWREPARRCWQFRYVSENEARFREMGVLSMWRPEPKTG